MDILSLTTDQLRRAAQIKEQIDDLTSELQQILTGSARVASAAGSSSRSGRRKMSPQARAKIAAAARARWARYRGEKGQVATGNGAPSGKRRKMSAAGRARIAAAARARWAKVRAAKAA